MSRSDIDIDLALSHHRAGRLAEAEAIYRRILKGHPSHARAAHLLGLAAHQDGRLSEALALIRHSLALDPAPADFHSNLGTVLAALGQKTEAELRKQVLRERGSPIAASGSERGRPTRRSSGTPARRSNISQDLF